jgi:hypothetical protein
VIPKRRGAVGAGRDHDRGHGSDQHPNPVTPITLPLQPQASVTRDCGEPKHEPAVIMILAGC